MENNETKECVLFIQNLSKQYGEGPSILEKLSMTVNRGEIYSLLGASGCGKTLLLSCILGTESRDSGNILVFGADPRRDKHGWILSQVGYMPQELSLYKNLTADENVWLYSLFYNVNTTQAREKWEFLKTLLDITFGGIQIHEMSGGEKRRISLGLAFIHSPKLLLLDEPTVGLDPLLRQRVWDYLREINRIDGVTTVITTHYTEETKESNMVGILRNGRIIAQDSPQNLMNFFNCSLLEEAVVALCMEDETGTLINNGTERHQNHTNRPVSYRAANINAKINSNGNNLFGIKSLKRIYAYVALMVLTILRHPVFFGLMLFVPAYNSVLGLLVFGSTFRGLHLSVVNLEIDNCESITTANVSVCAASNASCKFLQSVQEYNFVNLKHYTTESDALTSVQKGESWGYVSIPFNYSQHLKDFGLERQFASNSSIVGSRIKVRLDYSNSIISLILIQHLYQSYHKFISKLAEECDVNSAEVHLPLDFRQPVYGNYLPTFRDYVLPGVIVKGLFALIAPLTALLLLNDLKQGTFSRARLAGLRTVELAVSFKLVFALIIIITTLITTLVLELGFNISTHANFGAYIGMCLLTGIFCISLGLFVAIVFKNEISVMLVTILLYLILIVYGGALYPIEGIKGYWKVLGETLPTTMSINALRSVIGRGFGFANPLVFTNLLGICAWIVAISLGNIILFKRLKN